MPCSFISISYWVSLISTKSRHWLFPICRLVVFWDRGKLWESSLQNLIKQFNKPFQKWITAVLGIIWSGIESKIFPGKSAGQPVADILFSLTFFFWGLSGISMIIRKEIPFLEKNKITGIYAVISGIMMTMMGWGLALLPLISRLKKIISMHK